VWTWLVVCLLAAGAALAGSKIDPDATKAAGKRMVDVAAKRQANPGEESSAAAIAAYREIMDDEAIAGWLRVNAIVNYAAATVPGEPGTPEKATAEIELVRKLYAERAFEEPLSTDAALRHSLIPRLYIAGDYDAVVRLADQQIGTWSVFWVEAGWAYKLRVAARKGDEATRARVAYQWLLSPIADPAKAAKVFADEFCPAVRNPAVITQQEHYDMLNGIYRSYPKTDAAWQPFLGQVRAEMTAYQ